MSQTAGNFVFKHVFCSLRHRLARPVVRSGLRPTGLLDVPTLAALQLSAEQDNLAWVPPGGSSYSSGSSSGGMVPSPGSSRRIPVGSRYEPKIEEPGFLKRKLRGFTKDDEE